MVYRVFVFCVFSSFYRIPIHESYFNCCIAIYYICLIFKVWRECNDNCCIAIYYICKFVLRKMFISIPQFCIVTSSFHVTSVKRRDDEITTVSERSENIDPIMERLHSLKIVTFFCLIFISKFIYSLIFLISSG